jgi:hypothetical protein
MCVRIALDLHEVRALLDEHAGGDSGPIP